MLVSLTKKFLFIANLKTASTSIERALSPYAEIRLVQSHFGKHQSFSEFSERFKWLLSCVNVHELFIFGIMRDPADYVLSLYNSHHVEQFRNTPKLYTGDMDFGRFIAEWVPRNADQLRPQFTRFIGTEGRVVANLIISYDRLTEGLEIVADRLDLKELRNLSHVNPSPSHLTRNDLSPEHLAWINTRLEKDREFMARYCDRLLG
jgi:hypothetical protein